MIEINKVKTPSLFAEQSPWRKESLQYLDGGIVIVAIVLCILSYQYYTQDEGQKYILMGIFAAIGLYYSSKLFKKRDRSIASPVLNSDISQVVMLSENGNFIKQWSIGGNAALLIGKNTKDKEVDIDLSDSMYDALIHDEHAVMNFAVGDWYLEALHMPSSISIRKVNDKMRYRLTGNRPCKLEQGDTVHIANTRLLIK